MAIRLLTSAATGFMVPMRGQRTKELPMSLSFARCSRARPRIRPCANRSSTRTRDEDELARKVHGFDARPILEIEASQEENVPNGLARYSDNSRRVCGAVLLQY